MFIFRNSQHVHCPICGHDGKAGTRRTGAFFGAAGLIVLMVGTVVSALIIPAIALLAIAMIRTRPACKDCGFQHVLPLRTAAA